MWLAPLLLLATRSATLRTVFAFTTALSDLTGGNCIVYSVTCQKKSNPLVNVACPVAPTCNTVGDTTNCISFNTSFYTSDPITAHNARSEERRVGKECRSRWRPS